MDDIFGRVVSLLRPARSCLDIGPGIRPQKLISCEKHYCIEPHSEYAEWLDEHGYPVLRGKAIELLDHAPEVDIVFMLDVIEHMEKEEGLAVLAKAQAKAPQIVVFTPIGFKAQSYSEGEKDAWGMNGTYWQTHRSGWTPDDFPGWHILTGETGVPSFFALK